MPVMFLAHQKRLFALLACCLLLSAATGCAREAPAARPNELPGAGGSFPEAAVELFFDDLNQALADRTIADDDSRVRWAEKLAGYFPPSERIRQRAAFGRTLSDIVASTARAAAEGEADERTIVTLQVQPQPVAVRTTRQGPTSAEVTLVDARLYIKIVRLKGDRQRVLWEQTEPLNTLIGRSDGTIPLVRVDGRWFLSTN